MIDDTYLFNIGFYLIFGSICVFFIYYFILEIHIRRKRQKQWDSIKRFFSCSDKASLYRLFSCYKSSIKKHWLLGYIYPDI